MSDSAFPDSSPFYEGKVIEDEKPPEFREIKGQMSLEEIEKESSRDNPELEQAYHTLGSVISDLQAENYDAALDALYVARDELYRGMR